MTQRSAQTLYFFIGDNRWEKKQALKALREKGRCLEARVFDVADKSLQWDELLQSLRTFPLPPSSQIFVLRQIEKCPPRYQKPLLAALQGLPKQNVVVLETEETSLSGDFLEALKGRAELRLFQPLRREQLPAWMAARAQAHGKRIQRETCLELLERAGEDLFFLDGAIEQLALYAGEREPLTPEDVRQLIGPLLFRTGFELARAIGRREVAEALRLLSQLSPHERLQALVGSMGWHLRQLRQTQGPPQEGYSREELDQLLQNLLKLDVETKSGLSEETEMLEVLILSLAQKSGELSGEA